MSADLTTLLRSASSDPGAAQACLAMVYDELRRLARAQERGAAARHTLQPTALVHEAYLKLAEGGLDEVRDRAHFFALASRAMRQVLVDHARARKRLKRGGDAQREPLDDVVDAFQASAGDVERLHEALERLSALDEQRSRIVELHFFGQIPLSQVAPLIDLPLRTVERHWALARAWLRGAMEERAND